MTPEESPYVLEYGRWVNVRGVMRWREEPPPAITGRDAGEIVCRCGARATETCRTAQGHRTKSHRYRAVTRRCACGAELAWKRQHCDDCRIEAAREYKREWRRRKEAA